MTRIVFPSFYYDAHPSERQPFDRDVDKYLKADSLWVKLLEASELAQQDHRDDELEVIEDLLIKIHQQAIDYCWREQP